MKFWEEFGCVKFLWIAVSRLYDMSWFQTWDFWFRRHLSEELRMRWLVCTWLGTIFENDPSKISSKVLLLFAKEWESSFQPHSLIWKPEFPRSEDSILGNPILVIWFIRRKFFLNPPLVHFVLEEYRMVWSSFLKLTCNFVPLAYLNRRWKWAG